MANTAMNAGSLSSRFWDGWKEFSVHLPIAGTSSCIGRRSKAAGSRDADSPHPMKEVAREFLGCDKKPSSLQRMTVAHASQIVYGATSETVMISMPYVNKELGGDVQSFATLQSTTAGLSVLGGIAVGALQDRMGAKNALLLAHASAIANVAILSAAKSWHALVFAAIPALTQHGFQAATQVAVHCSRPADRSVSMGRIAMSYGVGWFGSAALLSKLLEYVSAQKILCMAVGSEIAMLSAILLCYPQEGELISTEGTDCTHQIKQAEPDSAFERVLRALQHPGVIGKLIFKFAVSISGGMIYIMVPQFALDPFGFTAAQTSRLMLMISGLQLVSQGAIVPSLGEQPLWKLQVASVFLLGMPMLGLALLPQNAPFFTLAVAPIGLGWHGLNIILNASLSCDVPEKLAGTMMGISMAPMTTTFLVAPMISAALFKTYGFKCVAGSACAALLGSQALVVALDHVLGKRDELEIQFANESSHEKHEKEAEEDEDVTQKELAEEMEARKVEEARKVAAEEVRKKTAEEEGARKEAEEEMARKKLAGEENAHIKSVAAESSCSYKPAQATKEEDIDFDLFSDDDA